MKNELFFILIFVFNMLVCNANSLWDSVYLVNPRLSKENIENDPLIKARCHSEYKSHVKVEFPSTHSDPRKGIEIMWVEVLDISKDLYLGKLLNKPENLTSVSKNENIIFKNKSFLKNEFIAIQRNGKYTFTPSYVDSALFEKYIKGIMAYRNMEFGHFPEFIPVCTSNLLELSTKTKLPKWMEHDAHYYAGRCFSESYSLDSSISEYKNAINTGILKRETYMSLFCDMALAYILNKREQKFKPISLIEIGKAKHFILTEPIFTKLDHKTIRLIYKCKDDFPKNEPCNSMRFKY